MKNPFILSGQVSIVGLLYEAQNGPCYQKKGSYYTLTTMLRSDCDSAKLYQSCHRLSIRVCTTVTSDFVSGNEVPDQPRSLFTYTINTIFYYNDSNTFTIAVIYHLG